MKKVEKFRSWKDYHREELKNPREAEAYLKIALEDYGKDKNTKALLYCLRVLVEAKGGIGTLAKKTHLTREHLYHVLSSKGNPTLTNFFDILHTLGFRISIEKIKQHYKKAA